MLNKLYDALKYVVKYELKSSVRRYIILGAFDGILLTLSILLSGVLAHFSLSNISLSIHSGLIATSISSTWNTLVVELGEKRSELEKIERQVLRSLKGTIYDYSSKISAIMATAAHGLSPFSGLLILYSYYYLHSILLSLSIGVVSLGALGLLYGERIRDKLYSALQLVSVGLITSIIMLFIVK
ncbi:MAG: hypothetical protein QW550_00750 [Saccharolobus sp.]